MVETPPIAVTGVGVVSPIGIGWRSFWQDLTRGRSGISPLEERADTFPRMAARVHDFDAREHIHSPHLRRMNRLSRMITAACTMALGEARIDSTRVAPHDIGIVIGSALGDVSDSKLYLQKVLERGPAAASPMSFPNLVHNAPASYAAMVVGAMGVNLTVAQAEVSGEQSILLACDLLRSRRARFVLAGGGDQFDLLVAEAAASARALSGQRGGREECCPYDVGRNGIVLGEGAAVLALEPLEEAHARQATVFALIEEGCSFSVPAPTYDWPTDASAAFGDMRRLLHQRSPDLVIGSANSSHRLDACEASFFDGLLRDNPKEAWLTSIKGAIGEFGAAGALSAAAGCLALHEQTVPPLCHRTESLPASLRFAERTGTARSLERVLVSGLARGGSGVGLLLRRNDPDDGVPLD